MTELETIAYTKSFIDSMAKGLNPITGKRVPESDLLNNVRVSRCLYQVSDYLRQLIENGGLHVDAPLRAAPTFDLPPEAVARFPFSDTPLTLEEMIGHLYVLAGRPGMASLHPQSLVAALAEAGLVEEKGQKQQRQISVTEAGQAAGLRMEERRAPGNTVFRVLTLDLQAQALVLDLLPRIIEIDRAV